MRTLLCLMLLSSIGCDVEVNFGDNPKPRPTRKVRVHVGPKGCPKCIKGTCPPADLPYSLRQENWGPSCGYASTVSSLNRAGREAEAQYVRRHYYGPSSIQFSQAHAMDRLGIKYNMERGGDQEYLEWASRTGRLPIIKVHHNHVTNFAGFCGDKAYILNNNHTSRYEEWNKRSLLNSWRSYGGVAVTPIDRPPPPPQWHWSRT